MAVEIEQASQWYRLKDVLLGGKPPYFQFSNQFYTRLVEVLYDSKSSEIDKLLAYRDALFSHKATGIVDEQDLPLVFEPTDSLCEQFGLLPDSFHKTISLVDDANELLDLEELAPIYRMEKRRHIPPVVMDPSLITKLNNENYKNYQGVAQKVAVRVSLTCQRSDTVIINLPTGLGKTLVAHALTAFAKEKELTLVIVPTTGLAIEQASRAKQLLNDMGKDSSSHYVWHGGQDSYIHSDIKQRIREGNQRILFSSPESICRSLLPVLFESAEKKRLANVIVDEAHLVEQWGVTFRPYFQILSALLREFRNLSPSGIKCVLMSATFTEQTLTVLRELFSDKHNSAIEVHGNFLRPEIQYKVRNFNETDKYWNAIKKAVTELPKPLIIYAVEVEEAKEVASYLNSMGVSRFSLFTGDTDSGEREKILERWNNDELDIIVATSAFGVGMDKGNIRSILHVAVPENFDRFYQEVGRAGRDGLASQSLLIYRDSSFKTAKSINNARLITVKLGFERWRTLWDSGQPCSNGDRLLDLRTLHSNLHRTSESNEEWNWRTLLLMRRAGIIDIKFNKPSPPERDALMTDEEYLSQRSKYYDNYYRRIRITPVIDNHLDPACWQTKIGTQREIERKHRENGFHTLKEWVKKSEQKCISSYLRAYYKIDDKEPEQVCAGCPSCRKEKAVNKYLPTVGGIVKLDNMPVVHAWSGKLSAFYFHQGVYYNSALGSRPRSLMRSWGGWISSLLETKSIFTIRTDYEHVKALEKSLPRGVDIFWMYEPLKNNVFQSSLWPELIIVPSKEKVMPETDFNDAPTLLLAPEQLKSPLNPSRPWWMDNSTAISLENFLLSIAHGDN